jgi:hypothetical protein
MLTGATGQVLPAPSCIRCVFMVKTALVAAFVAVALSACGDIHCMCIGNPYVPPSPYISPGLGFDAVVSDHDTAITIHTGQKLEVVLHARPGMSNWSNVRSSDTAVLSPVVNPAATAARGVTLAGFEAQKAGQATITASAGAACSPGQACPQFAVLYSVTVTVT